MEGANHQRGPFHLTGFIKSRWWAAIPDSRGCDGSHVSCQNWLRYQSSCLGKGKRGLWEGKKSTVRRRQPCLSNVSIMGREHPDEGGGTRRVRKGGKGVRRMGWGRGNEKTKSAGLSQRWLLDRWASPWGSLQEDSFWCKVKNWGKGSGSGDVSCREVWWFLVFWEVRFSHFPYVPWVFGVFCGLFFLWWSTFWEISDVIGGLFLSLLGFPCFEMVCDACRNNSL